MENDEERFASIPFHVWRFGAAKLFYDRLGIPTNPAELDYGVDFQRKLEAMIQGPPNGKTRLGEAAGETILPLEKEKSSAKINQVLDVNDNPLTEMTEMETAAAVATLVLLNEEANQKDSIWSPEKVPENISTVEEARPTSCGQSLEEAGNLTSDFSWENMELINGRWEDDVIWDVDEFWKERPQPNSPVLEATNVFTVSPKVTPPMAESSTYASVLSNFKTECNSPTMNSKLLWQNTGMLRQPFERPQSTSVASDFPKFTSNFYNISNDQFYLNKKDNPAALNFIRFDDISGRHSKLVRKLTPPFVKLSLSKDELRHFHRPQLTNERNAPVSTDPHNRHFFRSLGKRIKKKAIECSNPLGEPILMDRPIDLSGRDGEVLIVENCEEFPPLLSQVGMCSKIVNFCQRSSSLQDKENVPILHHSYGATTFVPTLPSPYLGSLKQGQIFSSLENNLYCSPIYYHSPSSTDFLVIRNRHFYMIREINASFTAGQQYPLIEVPEPNSAKARSFFKDLVTVFILRKFRECTGSKRQVNLDEVTEIFPTVSESNIRNWIKLAADLSKTGSCTWIVMKREFRLPTEEELEEMVSPEQCCAYFSMLAAEQRLKDAGYGLLLLSELADKDVDEKNSDSQTKKAKDEPTGTTVCRKKNYTELEEELQTAPWNTTAAFLAAAKGKCFLQIDGPADPTGCGEGFSYVRVSKMKSRSNHSQKENEEIKKVSSEKAVKAHSRPGGTGADLRRLSTKDAQEQLRKAKIPEKDIQKLTRREIIDRVKTLSTKNSKKAKMGDTDDKGNLSRRNKTRRLTKQERYKINCQRIFELQNEKLSSAEVLNTDEEDEKENTNRRPWTSNGDIHQIGESIEKILNFDKDDQILHEQEERERVELQLMMLGKVKARDIDIARKVWEKEAAAALEKKKESMDILKDLLSNPGRCLKLVRTFKNDDGTTSTTTEIVRDPRVIAVYLKIRTTKDEQFIKRFLKQADSKDKREETIEKKELVMKMKKKQAQELKKVERPILSGGGRKRKLDKDDDWFPSKSEKTKVTRKLQAPKRKCGKCGLLGHVSTSAECPMFIPKQEVKRKSKGNKKMRRPLPPSQQSKTDKEKKPTYSTLEDDLMLSSSSDSEDEKSSESDSDSSSTSDSDSSTCT